MRIAIAIALAPFLLAFVPTDAPSLPACPTEDSTACHWDARTQGNGLGRSFDVDASGNVTYTK